MAVLSSVAQPP